MEQGRYTIHWLSVNPFYLTLALRTVYLVKKHSSEERERIIAWFSLPPVSGGFLLSLLIDHEDGDSVFHRNIGPEENQRTVHFILTAVRNLKYGIVISDRS
jgi:hypothetical protein